MKFQPNVIRLLDMKRAAAYCGVGGSTFKKWKAAGIVQAVRMPINKLLFDKADLDEVINSKKQEASCENEGSREPGRFSVQLDDGSGCSNPRPMPTANQSPYQQGRAIASKPNDSVEIILKRWNEAYRLKRIS